MQHRHILNKTLVLLLTGGCCMVNISCFTLKYSTTGASIPPEAKTVSVQYFQNRAPLVEPNLDQQLTDGLKDYIQANTNLIIVNGTGDVDFEGTITGYEIKPASIVAGDVASKNRFTVTIRMKFSCYVNPDLDFEGNFSRYEDYDSNLDFESVKLQLTDEIQELLMEEIFNRAFVNW